MWIIPPIVGQKVTLNPRSSNYNDFRSQSRGGDGYIVKVDGSVGAEWLKGNTDVAITVVWEKGRTNRYRMDELLAIDSFKIIERVEFMSSYFHNILDKQTKDFVEHRVIIDGDDIRHYDTFDKQKRLDVLNDTAEIYSSLSDSYQNNQEVQVRYISTLEEIERTKRTEPVVLFLDGEGEDASTPKKHLSDLETSVGTTDQSTLANYGINPSVELFSTGHANAYNHDFVTDLRAPRRAGWNSVEVDTDFINPCIEILGAQYQPGVMTELNARTGIGRRVAVIDEDYLTEEQINAIPVTNLYEQVRRANVYANLPTPTVERIQEEPGQGVQRMLADWEALLPTVRDTQEQERMREEVRRLTEEYNNRNRTSNP